MSVFHVFLIVQMVPNCAKHRKWLTKKLFSSIVLKKNWLIFSIGKIGPKFGKIVNEGEKYIQVPFHRPLLLLLKTVNYFRRFLTGS